MTEQDKILDAIKVERARQDRKWGVQNHDVGKWSLIIVEELGEASEQALLGSASGYQREMIEAAASIVAAIESHLRQREAALKEGK